MRKRLIVTGKEGQASLKFVFAQMQTTENNLIINSKNKKDENYFRLHSEQDVEKFKRIKSHDFSDSIIIRWGTRIQLPEEGNIVYNTNKAISNSSNKYTARKLFREAGVNIPRLVTPADFTMEDLPIIARPFQHKQGKDFVVIKDYGSFLEFYKKNSGNWYFSAYIEKDAEYRIHCAHGNILSIMQKPKPEDSSQLAWNHSILEEEFKAINWGNWNMDLCKMALKACNALSLDFCGLDVIVKDGIPYVLEANTSPSLSTSPYNTEKYAKYFDWLLKSETKREHWPFEEKKKVTSLAWKEWKFKDEKSLTE